MTDCSLTCRQILKDIFESCWKEMVLYKAPPRTNIHLFQRASANMGHQPGFTWGAFFCRVFNSFFFIPAVMELIRNFILQLYLEDFWETVSNSSHSQGGDLSQTWSDCWGLTPSLLLCSCLLYLCCPLLAYCFVTLDWNCLIVNSVWFLSDEPSLQSLHMYANITTVT